MPKLVIPTKSTKRIYLPSTKDAANENDRVWVDVKEALTIADRIDVSTGRTAGDKMIAGITSMIIGWNYTEDGTPNTPMTPITQAAVEMAVSNEDDAEVLIEEYLTLVEAAQKGLDASEKKASSDTSQPDTQELTTPPKTIQV